MAAAPLFAAADPTPEAPPAAPEAPIAPPPDPAEQPAPAPSARVGEAVPPPPAAPAGAFDEAQAKAVLAEASKQAAYCRRGADPPGTAVVAVTFVASGAVSSAGVVQPPYAGTATAHCVAARLRGAQAPAFEGKPRTLMHRVRIY